jgi:LacI family transcriptional regulator
MTEELGQNNFSSVSVDDFKESYKLTSYLCDLGHKRIAILCANMDDESIGRLRLEGYKKALEDAGIEFSESLVWPMKDNIESYTMENGYQVTKELLKSGEEFTAVYAIADSLAVGACKAILEAGKRIPEDYSVAGFDGLDIAFYYNPSITTIRQPVEQIAKETIRILFDLIQKKTTQEHKIFPAELMIRESTREPENN